MTDRRLVVPGRFDRLEEIRNLVGEAAVEAGLDDTAVFHCQMAVDEACTNIIEHGYGGEDRGDISLACMVADGHLRIEIRDHAWAFDPAAAPEPRFDLSLEEMSGGGWGLYFMRRLMDEVQFTPLRDGNLLVMVKTRKI